MALSFLRRPYSTGPSDTASFEPPGARGVEEIPPLGAEGQEQQDFADLVEGLLSSLQRAPTPQAPKIGKTSMILGSLGDALQAYGRGQLGAAQGIGPFAQAMQDRRSQFDSRSAEVAEENRRMENDIRMSAFREQMTRGRPEPDQSRPLRFIPSTIDVEGTPTAVVDMYDAITGEFVGRRTAGPRAFAPAMFPGVEVGENGPQAGIFRIPRKPGAPAERVPGPGGSTLEPQVPTGIATEAGGKMGVLGRFPELMSIFQTADASVRGSGGKLDQTQNWIQSRLGRTSFGPIVAPGEIVDYYNSVKSVLFPIIKAGSGAVFPEAELQRWESRFPIPGVHTPKQAQHAWNILINEMITDIQGKYGAAGRTPPGLPTQQGQPSTVDDILKQYQEEYGAKPTP